LAAYAPTRVGWAVLVLQSTADAFGPTRVSIARTAALLILGMSLAAVVAWLLAGRLGRLYDDAIAARLRAEEAAEAATAARLSAEFATRSREELVALLSHDLRNPLTSIKVQVQLLQRRLDRARLLERAEVTSALGLIDTAKGTAATLLSELLDATQLRAGHALELQPQLVDMVALAQAAVVAHQHASDSHCLRLDAAVESLVGSWDATRLERVLGNLLTNAIKYSPDGGEIVVRVHAEPQVAVLTVRDHGVGIPSQDLPLVFDAYRRGTNVTGRIAGSGRSWQASKQSSSSTAGASPWRARRAQAVSSS